MIWHIAKREIYNNLNSLRFALTTVLLLALMVTNAVNHVREHPNRVQEYQDDDTESMTRLTSNANKGLYKLAQEGPGKLYKKPSPLRLKCIRLFRPQFRKVKIRFAAEIP